MSEEVVSRAIKLLARREHSGKELAQKLTTRGFSPQQVQAAIDKLRDSNLLSDTRFAAAYVRQKCKQFGDSRIRLDLRARGVGNDDIERALRNNEDTRGNAQRANDVLVKKYPNGVAAAEEAKARRFLHMRGFTADDIRHAISAARAAFKE